MSISDYPRYKVLQIMPAVGWVALVSQNNLLREFPLVCWALVEYPDGEKGENREVVGMVCFGDPVPADALDGFFEYNYSHG
jgi:hypothetical protein